VTPRIDSAGMLYAKFLAELGLGLFRGLVGERGRISFIALTTFIRSPADMNRVALRMTCTTYVCSTVSGKIA
jgi:hypothetical protein